MTEDIKRLLREAFDGDDIPTKNIALRKAADKLTELAAKVERVRTAKG